MEFFLSQSNFFFPCGCDRVADSVNNCLVTAQVRRGDDTGIKVTRREAILLKSCSCLAILYFQVYSWIWPSVSSGFLDMIVCSFEQRSAERKET